MLQRLYFPQSPLLPPCVHFSLSWTPEPRAACDSPARTSACVLARASLHVICRRCVDAFLCVLLCVCTPSERAHVAGGIPFLLLLALHRNLYSSLQPLYCPNSEQRVSGTTGCTST